MTSRNKTIILVSIVLLAVFIPAIVIAHINENANKKSIADSNIVNLTCEKSRAELVRDWETWLKQNNEYDIYLYGEVPAEHAWAINSLCNMSYSMNEKIRGNVDMIQWVLDKFCPMPLPVTEKQKYENLERQIESLLNFEVDVYGGYKVRRKSAISRLLYKFKIKVYENKLRSRIQNEEVLKLFDVEVEAWNKYIESTSDAYEKIVLGKDSYKLKSVFGNNYDFDIMDQRYRTLVCMYLNDYSVWNVDNQCRWDEVGYEYEHLPIKIKQQKTSDYDYSYQEKIDALNVDAETFKAFLNAHFALALKFDVSDEGYLLRHKSNTLERLLDYYNRPDSLSFN